MANRIPKWQLQEMFDDIAAKTDWDLDDEMVWGYFFTNSDRIDLELAATKLESEGYRYVDLYQPEDGEDMPLYILHVERIETHDVDSLYERNTELEAFATENGLDTYDGMDVGPLEDQLAES